MTIVLYSAVAASARHNMLLDSLNLVKNLHLRTAVPLPAPEEEERIVFSEGGQLNISNF